MSVEITDYESLRSYLLGRLPEEERIRLEERLGEDDLFALAEATEDELLDEYFRGELALEECRDLLGRLNASPAGRRRIELARGLAEVVKPEPTAAPVPALIPFQRQTPAPAPAAHQGLRSLWALAAAALVALALWIPGLSPAPAVFLHVPVAATTRGGDQALPEKTVPKRAPVELRLDLPPGEPFAFYTVSIKREGHMVRSLQRLAASKSGSLAIHLSAGDLPSGTYDVEVLGVRRDGSTDPVGYPSFCVVRR